MEETQGLQDYSTGEPVHSIDPVCGMKVRESAAAGRVGYAGQMYYFCSQDCVDAFKRDPGRYTTRPVGQ